MKKPSNLFYNDQALPVHGWGLDPTDNGWREMWLIAYDVAGPFPFLGFVLEWGSADVFREFTTSDPYKEVWVDMDIKTIPDTLTRVRLPLWPQKRWDIVTSVHSDGLTIGGFEIMWGRLREEGWIDYDTGKPLAILKKGDE